MLDLRILNSLDLNSIIFNFEILGREIFKPSVLLISIFFPPEIGGGATGAYNRASVLKKLGFSVFVLTTFPSYSTRGKNDSKYDRKLFFVESFNLFKVIRVRLLPIKYEGIFRRLIIFLNFAFVTIILIPKILQITGKLDLIYSRAPILFSSFMGYIFAKFTKSYFIYDVPDLWPEELINVKTPLLPLLMNVGKSIAKWSYRLPDLLLTVGNNAANLINAKYNPSSNVYGIPLGVDTKNFPYISKHIARLELIKMGIFPTDFKNKFIVLYSGLISSAQKVENLAYAAKKLATKPEIVFVIIGEGNEKQKLEKIKKDHYLNNFFLFSSQPRDLMGKIISAVDVCTVLLAKESIFEIALPTKFFEYIACRKPVIGVCTGELSELIKSYDVGRTVTQGDVEGLVTVINEISYSNQLLDDLANNCEKAIDQFTLDSITAITHEIFQKEGIIK